MMSFLTSIAHALLLKLPPELAHRVGMRFLRLLDYKARWFSKRTFAQGRVLILDGAPRLVLRGRVGLAAGFDKNAENFAGLLGLGFGFIEIGTVTPQPQPGNPKPRIWRVAEEGLINHLGFNSGGLEAFARNVERSRSRIPKGCLLANIGKNKTTPEEQALADYAQCFQRLKNLVDGFVVNLSSPNTPGLRDLQSESFLEALLPHIPGGIPVLVKLAPDLEDEALRRLCDWIGKERAFAGVVVTNTSRGIAQQTYQRQAGGYSGPKLFARSVECVRNARQALGTRKILIGVGGINSAERARQMLSAGADLVEVYTAFIYHGAQLVRDLQRVS